ncbi:hypothetical protein PCC7418_2638 [Halothece sp. PCC 7418]|uniref:WYL domain-containing protein n=1 Tax=Halothece sp. (strain PCC 7418) TaxID=65093 RepID=UPI0002A07BB8|nr:WYL domain-containing protein [Halothece sp. PCC 7418]AFZ44779.1 hypothetical protein PCC7418_2638 [Halothece sp. PCC 7418]
MMFCHILIGCPGSGKSTLATTIQKANPNYRIVSTDAIRADLFGDATIQGNWSRIEAEVFSQIKTHLKAGYPVIYDATNAKRPWRIGLLQHLHQYSDVEWLGWNLKTPLKTCLRWNQQREKSVPEEVIHRMFEALKTFPPIAAEGFATVYDLNPNLKTSLVDQFEYKRSQFSRTVVNRQNRIQNITRHGYSDLLDFERLMYLIHLLLTYPGIGNLQSTDPETIKTVIGKRRKQFPTEIDEICAFMSQAVAPIYADPSAIAQDLNWLEENGIIGHCDLSSDLKISLQDSSDQPTHSYSDLEPFQRLIQTIRLIIQEPFIWKKELGGTLNSFVERMREENLVTDDSRDRLRKDIEKVLKPYGILPEFPMKRGYFAGTAVLSQPDLMKVFQVLEAQAKHLEDPIALQVYEKFETRMKTAKLIDSDQYQVRAIHNRNIVDVQMLSDSSLAKDPKPVESAIAQGELLELGRFPHGGRFDPEAETLFRAYPLQLVFHNIGWYLGFEHYEGAKKGLLQFERLDRLFLGKPQNKARSRNVQQKSLQRLIHLYQSSGGIFLGDDPKLQKQYLSGDPSQREEVEVLIELWFSDGVFPFISEGTQRFPLRQMKMSQPLNRDLMRKNRSLFSLRKTKDPKFPHRFRVSLPQWSLQDIDLHRWILGFGGEAKVVKPESLREDLKRKGLLTES